MAYSESSSVAFNPPFYVGCLFPDSDDEDQQKQQQKNDNNDNVNLNVHENDPTATSTTIATAAPDYNTQLFYETIVYLFVEIPLNIRQFDDHPTNANAIWPEATFLAEWLVGINVDYAAIDTKGSLSEQGPVEAAIVKPQPNLNRLRDLIIDFPSNSDFSTRDGRSKKRVLELGSATGALVIYLRRHGVDITSSDMKDPVIANNIAHNCSLNNVESRHFAHSWGQDCDEITEYCNSNGWFDIILGSDILAYEDSFPNLCTTLMYLMPPFSSAVFYMCWKRRHKRKTENIFFDLLKANGFSVDMNRQKIYTIKRISDAVTKKETKE